jgi:predicted transcriptional regulator
MNLYQTEPIRRRFKVSWSEEYILGYVDEQGSTNTKNILDKANGVMSLATTHKYLTNLLDKGLLKQNRNPDDKRVTIITMTKRGVDFIKELSHDVK